ncbi:MAG: glycosyltransferase [Alicyclobacillus sp.]|nr:glycosyltransferase [Alicyclobacillus sp.]
MRILIVSYFFPPYNAIGAVRVGKTAKYLARLGHDVRVVAAADQLLDESLPLELDREKVIYTRRFAPRRTLKQVYNRVVGAARTSDGGPLSGSIQAVEQRRSMKLTLKRAVSRGFEVLFEFPDPQIGWFLPAIAAGRKLVREWRPDIIYASHSPATSLLVAAYLARQSGVKWVAELRDLWTDNHYYKYGCFRKWWESKLEGRTLASASGLVTVSEPMAEVLRQKYGKPTAVILNGYDDDLGHMSTPPTHQDYVRIVYTGSVYEGKRDPSLLFESIRMLGDESNRIMVEFYGKDLQAVQELANRYGIGESVRVHAAIPYKQSLYEQASADILLLLLWNHPAERGVYTGKLFEYIGARRPILALMPPNSRGDVASELIRELGIGYVFSCEHLLTAQLREWIGQKLAGRHICLNSAKPVDRYSRKSQTARLEYFLRQVASENG